MFLSNKKVLPKRQDKYAQHQIQPKAAPGTYSLNLADLSVSFLKIYLNKVTTWAGDCQGSVFVMKR